MLLSDLPKQLQRLQLLLQTLQPQCQTQRTINKKRVRVNPFAFQVHRKEIRVNLFAFKVNRKGIQVNPLVFQVHLKDLTTRPCL